MASTSPDIARATRKVRAPIGAFVVLVLCAILIGALLFRGWEFYRLDLDARIDHDDFRVLGPGELVGHGYGIVGTALILTNLLYLVRRRLARLPLGSMRVWLDLHVVTGLLGSILILFHSAFQLRTPIATVTSVSLLFVVLTGVIGRYIYALAPKPDDPQLDASLEALDTMSSGLGRRIEAALAAHPIPDPGGNPSFLKTLFMIPAWMRAGRARRRIVREHTGAALGTLDDLEAVLFRRVSREAARRAKNQARAAMGASLLRTWRGLHRFLAALMILSVSVHIAVAWFYGYRWLWSE